MRLVWLDLETTGLDERKNQILEIGISITDECGELVPITSSSAVRAGLHEHNGVFSTPVLMTVNEELDPFIVNMHTNNGLLQELHAQRGVFPSVAEAKIAQLIADACPVRDETFMAGNSLSLDQRFLRRFMPRVLERLHYRLFDVSSVAEFFRTVGEERPAPDPNLPRIAHRVTEDILWSKALFVHYRHLALHGLTTCNPLDQRQLSLFRGGA